MGETFAHLWSYSTSSGNGKSILRVVIFSTKRVCTTPRQMVRELARKDSSKSVLSGADVKILYSLI